MIAKRFATVVAALVAVVGAGAGGTVTAEARRTEAAAVTPGRSVVGRTAARAVGSTQTGSTQTGLTQTGLTQTGLTQTGMTQTGMTNVPAAFALPPGSNVTRLSDQESGASFVLTAPDSQTVLAFYRRQLALGSFTIIGDRTEHDATSLAFRDAGGWAGAIFATAHQVAVALKRA
ncbi:hypothetical protein [Actinoplanes sp. NPDC026619]|uniref:hypothetical protein n=1 Tax=Actinoplanes sp. NPDC026619 TaxID=3155798 RepID=UPI0033EDB977